VFLLAQAGVPFTSGFLAKFYVISAAVERGSYALAVIAMLASVVATFFYLRLVVVMYMADDQVMAGVASREEIDAVDSGAGVGDSGAVATAVTTARAAATRIEIPTGAAIAIGLALIFTIGAGLVPQPVIDFARHATVLHL
jgi:NADH-quinone oxidoreductase subunit N